MDETLSHSKCCDQLEGPGKESEDCRKSMFMCQEDNDARWSALTCPQSRCYDDKASIYTHTKLNEKKK